MINWISGTLLSFIFRAIFSLRYKVEVRGKKNLRVLQGEKGTLFLPNHTAYSEAMLVFVHLFPQFSVRPVSTEHMYHNPAMRLIVKISKAICMPRRSSSKLILKKSNEALHQIVEGLKKGDSIIYYPSGQTKSSAKEFIGGSSGPCSLLQKAPEANVVLIRTTGLWGSSFSRALTGNAPPLINSLLGAMKTLLQNLIFFAPRRKVIIEMEANPSDFPRNGDRLELNRYLESWYNRYPHEGKRVEEEPLQLVSRTFWRKDLPQIPPLKQQEPVQEISPKTQALIFEELRRILDSPGLPIALHADLSKDLGLDSLHMADLSAFVSKTFEIKGLLRDDFRTVQDILEIADKKRRVGSLKPGAFQWPEEPNRPDPAPPEGKTFPEAFLRVVDRMGSFAATGDDLVGVFTYKKLKKSAFVVAQFLREIPEERIAILLPTSTPALILFIACHFAGKIPVMLNWTLGERYLEDMVQIAETKTILSSWSFVDRLPHLNLENLSDRFLFLENVRAELNFKQKAKGLFLSLLPNRIMLRNIKAKEDDPYVILFTSGSESKPKAVPTSHASLIEHAKVTMPKHPVQPSDASFSFLPFFHAFGLSAIGVYTVLAGLKTVLHPDPTDGEVLAEQVERWKISHLIAPPNFLKRILHAAKKGQLDSVKNFVSASDRVPPDLIDQAKRLGCKGLWREAYGMTECTGAVTLPAFGCSAPGVGPPIPGIEICMIHPETLQLLPHGSEGEICICGKTVFKGYLSNEKDPFIELNGKKWFRSGDLGYFDSAGNLHISGRLKRFVKVGAEMISLAAVEEIFNQELLRIHGGDNHFAAVIADEANRETPQLVVFSTVPLDKESANQMLKEAGLSNLIKVSGVKPVEQIPLLGTGKVNYGLLKSLL